MKNKFLTLSLITLSILLCGYKFPEKLPAPMDYDLYAFEKLKFGQTSVNEFAYLAPTYDKPQTEGVYTIFSETDLDQNYKSLRIGFKNTFLDWIETEFAVPQSINKIQQNYGKPNSINKDYSKKFNYHDYGFFNIVTDKNNAIAFGMTLYDESGYIPAIAQVTNKLPDLNNFNFINDFIPGQLLENDFNAQYPKFLAEKTSNPTDQKIYSVPAKYLKNNKYYQNAELVFANGILSFVNLTPKNMTLAQIKDIYGEGQLQKSKKTNIAFMEYQNFIVAYNLETTKILNIGIISAN